jgi:FixJ family two-component response regulator
MEGDKLKPMADRELVIVLDDDTGMLKAMQRLLQVRGFDVEVFCTAEAFNDNARIHDAKCLVLDVHLDGVSGIDVRRQLTRAGHELPVIFVTGSTSEAVREAALEAGCVAVLKKPFPSSDLLEAVELAVQRSKARLS